MPHTAACSADDVLIAALSYARRGWRVLPVHSLVNGRCTCGKDDCGRNAGKHPSILNGVAGATSDEARVRALLTAQAFGARMNIALAAGWESGFFVLDVDGDVGAESLSALEAEHGALPATVESHTGGGGRHLLFAYPADQIIGNKVALRPKLDVRGDGGYIVAPPSWHKSGKQYGWREGHAPNELPVATPPSWLIELCSAASTLEIVDGARVRTEDPRTIARARAYVSQIPAAISGDKGHDRTFHVACVLTHGFTLDEAAAWQLLQEYNERCDPPWSEKELQHKINSALAPKLRHAQEFGHLLNTVGQKAARVEDKRHAVVVSLADVVPEEIRWLWYGRIARGKVTLLDGDPGLGKSTLSLHIASCVSTGKPLPDDLVTSWAPAGVVIMSVEDGLADTIRPRLDAAGADVARIVALTGLSDGDLPSLPTDVALIEEEARKIEAALIIIDPLMAYLGPDVNAHKDQDVRRALAPLAAMAERTGAAVLVVRHLNKKSGEAAIYRGGGSIGIIGAARSALLLAKDPTDDTGLSRVLASTKCNVSRAPASLRFTFTEQPNKMTTVEWQGVSPHTSEVLMAPPPTEEQRHARQSAETFLTEALKDGPRDSKAVANDAKSFGISERTLRRAREKICLAVKDPNVNPDGSWSWKWMLKDAPISVVNTKPRKF